MLKTSILGRVGTDAVAKEVNEEFVTTFNVAHSDKWTDANGEKKEKTTWLKVVRWDKSGKIAPFIKKGDLIYCSGMVYSEHWSNKETGEVKSQIVLRAREIELIGKTASTNTGSGIAADPSDNKEDDLPF